MLQLGPMAGFWLTRLIGEMMPVFFPIAAFLPVVKAGRTSRATAVRFPPGDQLSSIDGSSVSHTHSRRVPHAEKKVVLPVPWLAVEDLVLVYGGGVVHELTMFVIAQLLFALPVVVDPFQPVHSSAPRQECR